MKLRVQYIRSEQQFFERKFDNQGLPEKAKIIDLETLHTNSADIVLFPKNLSMNSLVLGELDKVAKFTTVKEVDSDEFTYDRFESMTSDEAIKEFSKLKEQWCLHNNLQLVEELFTVTDHLKKLFPNDRSTFMEELWFILKRNLGVNTLKIVYNDLEKAQAENEKDKLVRIHIEGLPHPGPTTAGAFGDQLMSHYERQFGLPFDIDSYDTEKGELVALATVQKSPMIIMANLTHFSRLQISLLKALFDGLK